MSPIYLPPSFCGKNANQLKKDFIGDNTRRVQESNSAKITLKKRIIIVDVITLEVGNEYFPIKDITDEGKVFWDLHDAKTHERVLRLRDDEFLKYFSTVED